MRVRQQVRTRASVNPADEVDRAANSPLGRSEIRQMGSDEAHGRSLRASAHERQCLARESVSRRGVAGRLRGWPAPPGRSSLRPEAGAFCPHRHGMLSMGSHRSATDGLAPPAAVAASADAAAGAAAERRLARIGVWAAAGLGALLFAVAALLWWRHGTTVFFDVMSAGIAACL